MNKEAFEKYLNQFSIFCLCVLVIFLPIAHTETIRALALGIPGGIWILRMIWRKELMFRRTPLDLPILLFTVILGLSVLTAVDWRYSLDEFQGEWLTGMFLFYMVINLIRTDQVKFLLGALLLGNLIMVGFGIFEFFWFGGKFLDYQVRASSLHSGYGTFSTYLVTVIPYLLIGIFFLKDKGRHQWGVGILLGLNLLALFLTHSRGAWVAIPVLLLVAGWMLLKKKILLLPMAFGCLIFLALAPESIVKHYAPLTSEELQQSKIETGHVRWELLKFSLEKIKENPFQMLGFGRGSFVKEYREFYLKYKGALLWHAHNTFLNIAFQTGIQGLLIFAYLLYALMRYTYGGHKIVSTELGKHYLLATFLMIITFFVRNLSDDFYVDDSALLFWALIGIGICLRKEEERPNRDFQKAYSGV